MSSTPPARGWRRGCGCGGGGGRGGGDDALLSGALALRVDQVSIWIGVGVIVAGVGVVGVVVVVDAVVVGQRLAEQHGLGARKVQVLADKHDVHRHVVQSWSGRASERASEPSAIGARSGSGAPGGGGLYTDNLLEPHLVGPQGTQEVACTRLLVGNAPHGTAQEGRGGRGVQQSPASHMARKPRLSPSTERRWWFL